MFIGYPIFTQIRPGLNNKLFTIYKFKTLYHGTGNELSKESSLGNFLRKTKLDELPQLINIIKNEMSLVGPRPLLKEYLKNESFKNHVRKKVLPGITGLAQINLFEKKNKWKKQLIYDAQYVSKQSFFTDLKIISLTFLIIFKTKKDYRNEKPLTYNN